MPCSHYGGNDTNKCKCESTVPTVLLIYRCCCCCCCISTCTIVANIKWLVMLLTGQSNNVKHTCYRTRNCQPSERHMHMRTWVCFVHWVVRLWRAALVCVFSLSVCIMLFCTNRTHIGHKHGHDWHLAHLNRCVCAQLTTYLRCWGES